MVVKGGSQCQNTFMGVDSAGGCLSVVLSTPMNVFLAVSTPLYNHVSSPTLSSRDEKQETEICGLAGRLDDDRYTHPGILERRVIGGLGLAWQGGRQVH